MKHGKDTEIDGILAELLKNLGEDLLCEIITKSYEIGYFPEEFAKSGTITLLKKIEFMEYNNYRTISIILRVSKILLGIL